MLFPRVCITTINFFRSMQDIASALVIIEREKGKKNILTQSEIHGAISVNLGR